MVIWHWVISKKRVYLLDFVDTIALAWTVSTILHIVTRSISDLPHRVFEYRLKWDWEVMGRSPPCLYRDADTFVVHMKNLEKRANIGTR